MDTRPTWDPTPHSACSWFESLLRIRRRVVHTDHRRQLPEPRPWARSGDWVIIVSRYMVLAATTPPALSTFVIGAGSSAARTTAPIYVATGQHAGCRASPRDRRSRPAGAGSARGTARPGARGAYRPPAGASPPSLAASHPARLGRSLRTSQGAVRVHRVQSYQGQIVLTKFT